MSAFSPPAAPPEVVASWPVGVAGAGFWRGAAAEAGAGLSEGGAGPRSREVNTCNKQSIT